MAEHCPVRPESLQPQAEQIRQPGPDESSVVADVYVWHYALLVVHVRKEEHNTDDQRQLNPASKIPAPFIPKVSVLGNQA